MGAQGKAALPAALLAVALRSTTTVVEIPAPGLRGTGDMRIPLAVSGRWLAGALDRITTDNAQQEYYLTDVIGILVDDGHVVAAHKAAPEEGLGINSVDQIEGVERALLNRDSGA